MRNWRKWTPEEDAYLTAHYEINTPREIAFTMNRSESSIKQRADKIGLKLSPEEAKKRQLMACFQRGNTPHNKGMKMPDYVREKCKNTFFKKGQKNWNERPDGTMRKEKGRWYIRVSARVWVPYNVYLWELYNPKVNTKTHCVAFKNGDSNDFRLCNLELITRQENLRRNSQSRIKYPPEIIELQKKLKQLRKAIKDAQQHTRR